MSALMNAIKGGVIGRAKGAQNGAQDGSDADYPQAQYGGSTSAGAAAGSLTDRLRHTVQRPKVFTDEDE